MKIQMFALALAALMSTAPPSAAQSLWRETVYGMSLEQVSAVVPDAMPPEKPERLTGGAEELLRLENVDIADKRFVASFFFESKRLCQVTLSLTGSHTLHEALLIFDSLADILRSKYGPELSRKDTKGVVSIAQATWMADRTNIIMIAMNVGAHEALLNINYQLRISKDADNL